MRFKRDSGFWIMWLIAMVTMVIIAFQYAYFLIKDVFSSFIPITDSFSYKLIIAGSIVGFFLLVALVYFVGQCITKGIKRHSFKPNTKRNLQIISFILVLIIGIGMRFLFIYNGNIKLIDNGLFEVAKVTGKAIPSNFDGSKHGLTYLFVSILHFFMVFLGNGAMSVVITQTVFQIACILLIFGVGRRLFGFCTGITASLILGIVPMYVMKIYCVTPASLWTFLFLLGMYLYSLMIQAKKGTIKLVFGIAAGIVTGLLIYLDGTFLLLLLVWLFGFVSDLLDESGAKALLYYLLSIVLTVGVTFGIMFSDAMVSGVAFRRIPYTWYVINSTIKKMSPVFVSSAVGWISIPVCLALVGFALMTCIGFVRRKETDLPVLWVLMLFMAWTPVAEGGYIHDSAIAIVIYTLLAAVGIRELTIIKESSPNTAMDAAFEYIENKEEQEASERSEQSAESTVETEPSVENEELNEAVIEKQTNDEKAWDPLESTSPEKKSDSSETIRKSPARQVVKQVDELPGMIPNPLPLPQRRTHAQIDFKHDVNDDEMFYDLDISDVDDFDI